MGSQITPHQSYSDTYAAIIQATSLSELSKEPVDAKLRIYETVCQARGYLFQAPVFDTAFYDFYRLVSHLQRHFPPECIDPSRFAHIEAQKRHEKEESFFYRVCKKLSQQRSIQSVPQGINHAEFVTVSGRRTTLRKAMTDRLMSELTAEMLFLEKTEWEIFAPMGGVNELIASHLNILFDGKFAIPLATRRGDFTIHAYVDDTRSLYDVLPKDIASILRSMPLGHSQWFIFGQLALGTMDCHADNVLLDPQNHPIAIDFGQSLGADPLHPWCNLNACYLNWPAMDAPLSQEDLGYWKALDIKHLMNELRPIIEMQCDDLRQDDHFHDAIAYSLFHLEMRLLTLQQAILQGMTTLRQITALFLPPFTQKTTKTLSSKVKEALLTYDTSPQELEIKVIHLEVLAPHFEKHGFKHAWRLALEYEDFEHTFREEIKKQIEHMKTIASLYGESTCNLYRAAKLDLSSY